jgi:uncharacterized membrane protein YfcA
MPFAIWLTVGLFVGGLGTLIGAGGGFLLVPILLFAYRGINPEVLTAWSLVAVFFNSVSGTVAYARQRRIDYRSGIVFASAALPGAWFGARLTSYLSRSWFTLLFGAFLLMVSTFLLLRATKNKGAAAPIGNTQNRYTLWWGAAFSLLVGLVSNVFGIGGRDHARADSGLRSRPPDAHCDGHLPFGLGPYGFRGCLRALRVKHPAIYGSSARTVTAWY